MNKYLQREMSTDKAAVYSVTDPMSVVNNSFDSQTPSAALLSSIDPALMGSKRVFPIDLKTTMR